MIDLSKLGDAIQAHDRVARIVIAGHKGSTPRETGAAMLVWDDGQDGTIGGGRLEWEATQRARTMLAEGPATGVRRQPLGPALGQCCGGSVTLVTELWDAARYRSQFDEGTTEFAGLYVRRVEGDAPLPVRLRRRLMTAARQSQEVATQLTDGWLIEQVWIDPLPVYIYGAGHVGHALATVLAPLPRFEVHVVDVREMLFAGLPDNVRRHHDRPPHEIMAEASADAAHFIMTPDHEYDLELCHRVLGRDFGYAGLIGSATKWARFRKRLQALGHGVTRIDRIECPIGDPALGKHPHAIAVGVVARLLARGNERNNVGEDVQWATRS